MAKIRIRPRLSLWICFGLLLFAPAICYSQTESPHETKPFLVFEGTQSPGGRYTVAWGLPKHPDVWAKVWQFDREHPAGTELTEEGSKQADEVFESVSDVAQDVENYIVDVRDGKIVRKLDCPRAPGVTADRELEPEYWIAGLHPNRHSLDVVWSRAGDFVLVDHTYRWDCVTFCAVLIRDGKAGPPVDLNKKLSDAVRNFVAKSFPRGSGYSKNDVNVSFDDVQQLSDTRFSAHAEAGMGKNSWSAGAVVDFTLTPSDERTSLKVLDVHEAKEKEIPGTKEHALEKADRHLNFAYAALQQKLDANAKEALRKEEHEWLAERDKIDDQFKRAEFIEGRARELEKRTPAHLLSPSKE